MYPFRVIKIDNPKDNVTFKVNGQKLKPYMEYQPREADIEINLSDPPNLN